MLDVFPLNNFMNKVLTFVQKHCVAHCKEVKFGKILMEENLRRKTGITYNII